MGLLDRFRGKVKQANSALFSFFLGSAAPDMKSGEFLGAYKGWVYACVNAIAEDVATLNLKLQRLSSGEWIDVDSHLALSTLYAVNPFMSSYELMLYTASFLELDGNTFWYMPKGNSTKKPAEIWVLDPSRVTIVKDAQEFISGYVYRNEKSQSIPVAKEEILHFKRFNPQSRYRGMGTVQAAALAIDTDQYAAEWNRNFFYNSAMPSATLETDGTITDEQFKRIKAEWDSRYKGLDNAHKLAILQGGLKFHATTISQKDMEFLEQRRYSRDEIMGIFRVPKAVLGITEDVNRANAEATEYVFAKRVIKPRMEFIVDRLNEFYLPLFGLDNSTWRFTFADPVPQNQELQLKAYQTALNNYMTINEVRAETGLDPVPGGEELYIQGTLVPLSQIGTTGTPQTDPNNTPPAKQVNVKKLSDKVIAIATMKGSDYAALRVKFISKEIKKQKEVIKAIFNDQKTFLVENLKKTKKSRRGIIKSEIDDVIRILFEGWEDFTKILEDASHDSLEATLFYAGKQALAQLNLDQTFDLENPRAVNWLKENALKHAKTISGTMKDEAKAIVIAGVESGTSVDDIAKALEQFYEAQADWKALRVARTEVIGGYAEGTLEGFRQSDTVTTKRWLTAQDDKVEPECAMNEEDGAISVDAAFSSGDYAPPVHPNCRCVLTP